MSKLLLVPSVNQERPSISQCTYSSMELPDATEKGLVHLTAKFWTNSDCLQIYKLFYQYRLKEAETIKSLSSLFMTGESLKLSSHWRFCNTRRDVENIHGTNQINSPYIRCISRLELRRYDCLNVCLTDRSRKTLQHLCYQLPCT